MSPSNELIVQTVGSQAIGSEVPPPPQEVQIPRRLSIVHTSLSNVPWDREEEVRRVLIAAGQQLPGVGLHYTPPETVKLRFGDEFRVSTLPVLEPVSDKITRVALSSHHLGLGDIQDFLASLKGLQRIELAVAGRLTELQWTCERELPQVESLRISGESGSLAAAVQLAEVCGLRSLDLSQWQGAGEVPVASLLRRVSSPGILNLRGLQLRDRELSSIAKLRSFESLEALDLSHNPDFKGGGLFAIVRQATSLLDLNLFNCSAIEPVKLAKVLACCTRLERLFLNNCVETDDEVICQIRSSVLKDLNLNYCSKIGPKAICALAKNCPNLKTAFLRGCREVTVESLIHLVQQCTKLEKLDITECGIEGEELFALKSLCEERGVQFVKVAGPRL